MFSLVAAWRLSSHENPNYVSHSGIKRMDFWLFPRWRILPKLPILCCMPRPWSVLMCHGSGLHFLCKGSWKLAPETHTSPSNALRRLPEDLGLPPPQTSGQVATPGLPARSLSMVLSHIPAGDLPTGRISHPHHPTWPPDFNISDDLPSPQERILSSRSGTLPGRRKRR